jgi:hypothetical protein
MKKALAIIIVISLLLATVLVAFSPFLTESAITIESNIPLKASDIFWKIGPFFYTYFPKKTAVIAHSLLKANVSYNELPIYDIKFDDGIFGLTKDGFIIKESGIGLQMLQAKINSDQWDDSFKGLFRALDENNLIDKIDSFYLNQKYVAFFDKNGILNIIGDLKFNEKLQEYMKTEELFSNKLKTIKQIDFRFDNQSVIIWR